MIIVKVTLATGQRIRYSVPGTSTFAALQLALDGKFGECRAAVARRVA